MNIVENTKRAKQYMESLAQGIDPISGSKIPPDSVLNQERLSRCFLYVADVLQTMIEQDPAPSPSSWDPLLASGALEQFDYSAEPLSIGAFVRQLNSLRGSSAAKTFPANVVTSWLIHEGFLTAQAGSDGEQALLPSRRGEVIGISAEAKKNDNGTSFTHILYNEAAQRFLVASLDRIIAYHQAIWARRLTAVDPDTFPYSAQPVRMLAFLRQLNGTYGWTASDWIASNTFGDRLIEMGFLRAKRLRGGKESKFPSLEGEAIGIYCEKRNGISQRSVFYNEAAQRFIVTHLREIVLL